MTRLRPEGVIPIEVWDLPVSGRPLQSWRSHARFPRAVADTIRAARRRPPAHWASRARRSARRIEHVHLLGGGATPELRDAVAATGMSCTLSADPVFAAVRAAPALRLERRLLCADVGQTAVKLMAGGRVWRVERDATLAPFRDDVPLARRPAARRTTIGFLARAFASALASAARENVSAAVIALPCELADDGAATGCGYCWGDPDGALIPELSRRAGLDPSSVHVLNDAELAAVAARLDRQVPASRTTLVLTIGFGVGGALLDDRA